MKRAAIIAALILAAAALAPAPHQVRAAPAAAKPSAVAPVHPCIASGRCNAGMPPARFQGEVTMLVTYVPTEAVTERCIAMGAPTPPEGFTIKGCHRDGHSIQPIPCEARFAGEQAALIACHENAHRLGWPGTHGD